MLCLSKLTVMRKGTQLIYYHEPHIKCHRAECGSRAAQWSTVFSRKLLASALRYCHEYFYVCLCVVLFVDLFFHLSLVVLNPCFNDNYY